MVLDFLYMRCMSKDDLLSTGFVSRTPLEPTVGVMKRGWIKSSQTWGCVGSRPALPPVGEAEGSAWLDISFMVF